MKSIRKTEQMADYIRDESRAIGSAEAVFFPESEADVVWLMKEYPDTRVTVQGSRTGLTAGSVPDGGIVLNLSRMNKVLKIAPAGLSPSAASPPASPPVPAPPVPPVESTVSAAPLPGCHIAVVQPGLALQTFRDALQEKGLWFPPDPTETSASIGGMIANNSSGARTYRYGSMREHVHAIRVVLRTGEVLRLERSGPPAPSSGSPSAPHPQADDGPVITPSSGSPSAPRSQAADGPVITPSSGSPSAPHPQSADGPAFAVTTEAGRVIRGRLPNIPMPAVTKNTAGYHIKPGMDLIDLFIGSEGTLGIVTEAELIVRPTPAQVWGCMAFFNEEEKALSFVERTRGNAIGAPGETAVESPCSARNPDAPPAAEAIEYFDHNTLALMRQAQDRGEILTDAVPVPADRCAVYVEYAGATREDLYRTFISVNRYILNSKGDPAETWLATGSKDLGKLKEFRHAAPVCVNRVIAETKHSHPQITKLGTDMSVPDGCLREVLRMYRQGLGQSGRPSPHAPDPSGRSASHAPFRAAIFGHIGNNHVHVNIMPRDPAEYQRGKALYAQWAKQVVKMGGSVSAEHGIGKIKRWLLQEMYSREQIEAMRALKRVFDPKELLGVGTIFVQSSEGGI